MTRCGMICTCLLGLVALIALVTCYVLQNRRKGYQPQRGIETPPPERGTSMKTPVVFRRGETRFLTCNAGMDIQQIYFEGLWGCDNPEKRRNAGMRYARKELAAILAEQALAAGGIRFSQEGGELRAELRVLMPEKTEAIP